MVVVRLTGGLGNQMFNYAFAKFLQKYDCEVVIDASWVVKNARKSIGGGQLENLSLKVFHSRFLCS